MFIRIEVQVIPRIVAQNLSSSKSPFVQCTLNLYSEVFIESTIFPAPVQEKLQFPSVHGGLRGKGRKWKLWRTSSGDQGSIWRGSRGGSQRSAASEASDDASSVAAPADPFTAAVATVTRAPARDFMAVRQEWAAIRIQTAFRGFLVPHISP